MGHLKRALLSVWHHKVRSILLACLFFVISFLLLVSTSLTAASRSAVGQARKGIGSEVTISVDTEKAQKDGINDVPPLNPGILKRLSGIHNVTGCNYLASSGYVVADGISMIVDKDLAARSEEQTRAAFLRKGKPELAKSFQEPNAVVYGALSTEKTELFLSGGYSLLTGRQIRPEDSGKQAAMVSRAVADKNHLSVGSQITLKPAMDFSRKVKYTVVGIFSAPHTAYSDDRFSTTNPDDMIFVPYPEVGLYLKSSRDTEYSHVQSAQYFLDSPESVPSFEAQARKILGNPDYKAESSEDLYKEVILPIDGISRTAAVMGWCTGAAGCMILFLVVLLSINGRRREFGVLLAMGEKKIRIILQTAVEVLIPVVIGCAVSAAAGGLAAGHLGDLLSQSSVQSANRQVVSVEGSVSVMHNAGNFYSSIAHGIPAKIQTAKPVDKMDLSLTATDYGVTAGVCLLITLISVIIPCIRILRLRPREILLKK